MPGDRLLHPIALAAVTLMAFNDHWLKLEHPGVLSGKLSDVAGLVVLPLTLFAVAEVGSRRVLGGRALLACMAIAVAGYTLVEVWKPAELAWCWSWGLLQWPVFALSAAVHGDAAPPIRPVQAWSDWTDLLVLPAVGGAWLARRRHQN